MNRVIAASLLLLPALLIAGQALSADLRSIGW